MGASPKKSKSASPKKSTKTKKTWAATKKKTAKPKVAKKTTKDKAAKAKVLEYDSNKEYKLRMPKSSWILFNAHNIAQIKKNHPEMRLGQQTKLSGQKWHKMNDEEREPWVEAAAREKLKWQTIKKQLKDNGNDFSTIPGRWLQIIKKTKKDKESDQKDDKKDEETKKSP